MSKEHRPEGHLDKTEENRKEPEIADGSIENFKALTKRLLGISNQQLREEQKRYEEQKRDRPRRRK
jgi:hypothetical protein